ncbi:MAG: GNAT family N-acetyltransferase [Nocardioides sp.]
MEIEQFTPDDADALRAWVEVHNAVRRHDSPWKHPLTEHEAAGALRFGWDLEVDVPFLGSHDGQVVGTAAYGASQYDNLHLAFVEVFVLPEHRRRGHGGTLFEAMVEQVRGLGRTSVLTGGWESDAARGFAAAHGLEQKSVEVNRRQVLAELDWAELDRLHAESVERAAAYDIAALPVPTPDDQLAVLAEVAASINDAPTDDLDIEDEVYSAERMRAYETAMGRREIRLHRLVARHRETGALAGQTVMAVDGERPELAEQHDTTVAGSHRGHRLGTLLKLDMLRRLRETEPQLTTIDTWNAESNDFMVGVNETMGYRAVGRALDFQKSL